VRQALTIDVTEGPRTLIRSVTFSCNGNGACVLPDATLQAALTAPGPSGFSVVADAPFYLPDLDRARDALQVEYVTRGYLLASIELPPPDRMVSADRTRADVRFVIREGPQIRIDHILVVGNNRTKASTIRSQLQIHPGDPLDLSKLAESQRRLTDLGLFRRVRVTELQQASEDKRDVLVVVEEAPTTTMAYGGGVEGAKRLRERNGAAVPAIELAPRVLFDIGRRNLWGKNRSITFNSSAAVRPNATTTNLVGTGLWEYRAIATYREPRIFRGASDLTVTGGVEQAVRTSYTYNRRALRGQVAHQLTPRLGLYGRYSVERTHILSEQASVEQQVLIDRLFSQFLLSKASASLVADTRDDALDPSRGMLTSFELDLAPRLLGSEVGFAKTLFQTFVYRKLPTSRRIVFAGGARLGLARGFLGPIPGTDALARTVPISERFFSGNAVRGFVEDRLGTPDTVTPDGFPSGGNSLLILNSELRVSITKDLAAVAFADAGNVFGRISELSVGEIRPGLGFGIRYKSPFGPIRLDLGFNPARRIYGGTLEPLTSIYFGVGQAF
jgi:outer membrane protein assembly factor BamA